MTVEATTRRWWAATTAIATRPTLVGRSRVAVLVAAGAGMAIVGFIDAVTSNELSSAILYLPVVLAATLFGGTVAGVVTAASCAVLWTIVQITGEQLNHPALLVWNAIATLAVFELDVALLVALRSAARQARDSNRRSRQFVGDAAHQLRAPLTSVQVTAEALLTRPNATDSERLLANLATEASRAGRLLTELLRLARLDQREPMLLAPCDVLAVARAEVERLYGISDAVITVDAGRPPPQIALVDERAIGEAMANLIDNASRHAATSVVVWVGLEGPDLVIRVSDDGPGLAPRDAERAFERFVTFGPHRGSGLGLPIARGLIRAHGGDVYFDGSAFVVRLPYHPAGAESPLRDPRPPELFADRPARSS